MWSLSYPSIVHANIIETSFFGRYKKEKIKNWDDMPNEKNRHIMQTYLFLPDHIL